MVKKEAKAMNQTQLRKCLEAMTDSTVLPYQNAVITDTRYPMLGIRVGKLRQLARQIAREDWQSLTQPCSFETYEQVLVTGLIIAYARVPFDRKTNALRTILPCLDSWAMTDTIVPTLKPRKQELEQVRAFALECLAGQEEYTVRFGVIMLMDYFLTQEETAWTAEQLTAIRDERYYVRMAVAWCLAEMAVHDPQRVLQILREGKLDTFTHRKTIQKMQESLRISPQLQQEAKLLKERQR